MQSDTTTNFWKAVSQYQEPETKSIEYRLYYNDDGTVLCYTMEELSKGNFIVIDQHTYNQFRTDLLVKDGKIVQLTNNCSWKLCPSAEQETYGCHPADVSIVVENEYPSPQYWSVKTTHDAD